jgi:hypothetical protein
LNKYFDKKWEVYKSFPPMRGIPPQAFSKQDILKAMEWLEKQSDQVRSLATNADALMGLYKKALIYGDSFVDKQSPVSEGSFRSELKDIAERLGSFDEASNNAPPMTAKKVSQVSPLTYQVEPTEERSLTQDMIQKENIKISIQRQMQTTKEEGFNIQTLDSLTQSRVKEIRTRFNLSKDEEAIRMLVTVGYEKLQNI